MCIYTEETGVNSKKNTSNCSFLGIYLVVSEKVCTFAKVEKNAPRKSLERSDSALLFRLLDRASEAATESGRGGLRIRPLIEWEGRRSRQGSGEGTPQRGFGGRAPYQNTRYKFCMPSLSPTKIRDDQG